MHSPHSPTKADQSYKATEMKPMGAGASSLLTPPDSAQNSSIQFPAATTIETAIEAATTTPVGDAPKLAASPNQHGYYQANLSRAQFNSILVNSATNLLKILYSQNHTYRANDGEIKSFIIEILKRSKTSIQTLQLACFYVYKLIHLNHVQIKQSAKKVFLGLIIIASKFNQDYNYSFKTWCKICGIDPDQKRHIRQLREIEVQLLLLLNHELMLHSDDYVNWCNTLLIFGFDFIKTQVVKKTANSNSESVSEIVWDLEIASNVSKISKWHHFFRDLNIAKLNLIKIGFDSYYRSQMGHKVFVGAAAAADSAPDVCVNRKRCFADAQVYTHSQAKKLKV
ncbi:uncharacterized protein LODBEIA_P54930 [Lodderomyces beijingensis]|uniref:Cyclin N-terminal domain-containing protein n=1 Tax=Lodderomyces beijingensis TaxID=1775926 RepID=A0ABP0ZTQ0_9ASCO